MILTLHSNLQPWDQRTCLSLIAIYLNQLKTITSVVTDTIKEFESDGIKLTRKKIEADIIIMLLGLN